MHVDVGVVAHQPLGLDPMRGVEGESALDEAGHGRCFLVTVELRVAEPRVVVDERVHPLATDLHPLLDAAAIPITGNGMTRRAEPDEPLRVDVEQVAGTGPLVAARQLARRLRRPRDPRTFERPPDGRMRVAGLAGDQPRPPAAAPPGATDPVPLLRGQKPRAVTRPRRAILEAAERSAPLDRGLRPTMPPLTRGSRRNAATSRRFPTRAAALNIRDQCTTTSKSETSVTVKRHPGPS